MTNARAIHDPKRYQPMHHPSELVKKSAALGISCSGGARNPHVFQYTLRFLRSDGTRPPFARDDFFTSSQHGPSRAAPALFGWLWGLGLSLCGPVVHADAAARHYAIPPQSLNDALMTFALQSDLKLVVPADLIRGLPSQGLTGDHSPEQGLQCLLTGSGMRYRLEGSTLTIERVDPLSELVNQAKQPLRVSQATPEKPKQQTQPKPKADATTELPEMTVTASPIDDKSYNPPQRHHRHQDRYADHRDAVLHSSCAPAGVEGPAGVPARSGAQERQRRLHVTDGHLDRCQRDF